VISWSEMLPQNVGFDGTTNSTTAIESTRA
jgi:hypothetical protein